MVNHKLKNFFIRLFQILIVITFVAKSLDTYRSPDFIQRNFFISSNIILLITLIYAMILRFFNVYPIKISIIKLFAFLFAPLYFLTSLVIVILNAFNSNANFVYGIIPLQVEQIFIFGIFLFTLSFIFLPSKILRQNYQKIVFYSPIVFVIIFLIYGYFPSSARWHLGKEDGFIENLQFIVLLFSSLISLFISEKFILTKKYFLSFIFFLAFATFLVTAGDEISWGGRLFNLQVPEFFTENNTQNELTIHNQYYIEGLVPLIYASIGFYGFIAFYIKENINSKKFKRIVNYFVPDKYLGLFFLFPFIYSIFLRHGNIIINGGEWAEFSELILYTGVFLHLVNVIKSSNSKNEYIK